MKRISLFLCTFFLICTSLFAAEANNSETTTQDNPEEKIESDYVYQMNQAGDQFIQLGINVNIPYAPSLDYLNVGGSGLLNYERYLTDSFSVGGTVAFGYDTTVGENVLYFVPIMGNVSYLFSVNKFEIPVTLNIGGAFENYIDRIYFGLAVEPEVGFYYRYSSDWSFGGHAGVFILPQWYSDSSDNYTGIIPNLGLSVRYHF
ncbi:MAG: hypothetical protein BKP49_03910 [Treponema sp. CETP13]|nr:MAG: hypothetical protein BKP49_03910 [Treponema sp. CETP13]